MREGNPENVRLFSQHTWRLIGGVSIVFAGLMAVVGAPRLQQWPVWVLIPYWLGFLVLLLVAMLAVIIDLRYIRLEYLLAERDIFEKTVGGEDFRKSLREAQRQQEKRSTR